MRDSASLEFSFWLHQLFELFLKCKNFDPPKLLCNTSEKRDLTCWSLVVYQISNHWLESKNTTAGTNFVGFGKRETKYVRFNSEINAVSISKKKKMILDIKCTTRSSIASLVYVYHVYFKIGQFNRLSGPLISARSYILLIQKLIY